MKTIIREQHHVDAEGKPCGGVTSGTGIEINWQDGPLGRGEARRAPNGAFVEDVIQAAVGRLKFYQTTKFACVENNNALVALDNALTILDMRTQRREAANTEGTHEGN